MRVSVCVCSIPHEAQKSGEGVGCKHSLCLEVVTSHDVANASKRGHLHTGGVVAEALDQALADPGLDHRLDLAVGGPVVVGDVGESPA